MPTLTSAASAGAAARIAATAARPTYLFTLIMMSLCNGCPVSDDLLALFVRRNILLGAPKRRSAGADIAQIVIVSHPDLIEWSKGWGDCLTGVRPLRVRAI